MRLQAGITSSQRWIERILALLVFSGIAYAMGFLWWNAYLPAPFFYQPSDTYMDWFNVAEWAHDPGAYDSWGSVYLPLNFLVAKLFSLSACYIPGSPAGNAIYARSCDWLSLFTIHAAFILCAVIASLSFVKHDRPTAFYRAFALSAGLPMTVALERGNLIILAFLAFMLGYGPLLRAARWRWVALGLAVNFKIYLVASVFGHLLRRRWRAFEGALLAVVIVYLLTYVGLGIGSLTEISRNIAVFTQVIESQGFADVFYSASYNPHITVLTNVRAPVDAILGRDLTEPLLYWVYFSTKITQAIIAAAAIAIWLRPEVVSNVRATNLALCFAFLSAESYGYSYIFVIFLTFFEKWQGTGRIVAIVAAYALCFHFEYPLANVISLPDDSYLGGRRVEVPLNIALGAFVRPGVFYLIPFALSCATIAAVWKDIQAQGWKSRWRYRHDLPIMVGPGAALPPGGS